MALDLGPACHGNTPDGPCDDEACKGHGSGYWYFISTWYCPICGRDDTFRERRYTPRPDDWYDRHEFKEVYDYCDAL